MHRRDVTSSETKYMWFFFNINSISSKVFMKFVRTFSLILNFNHWSSFLYVCFKFVTNSSLISMREILSSNWQFKILWIWWNFVFYERFSFLITIMIIIHFMIMNFMFIDFTSSKFFNIEMFSIIAINFRRDNAFETTWSLSDLILIFMKNVNRNCETQIRRKLSLFVFAIIRKIWFTISAMIAWFVKIDIDSFLHDFMKCRIFLIIYITSIISNSVSQYLVSAGESRLFKNMMNWI